MYQGMSDNDSVNSFLDIRLQNNEIPKIDLQYITEPQKNVQKKQQENEKQIV